MKLVREHINEEQSEFRFMKGPSKEKILKTLEGKTLKYKFFIGVKHNLLWLVQYCINEGIDPSIGEDRHPKYHNYNDAISISYNNDYKDIFELLFNDKRVKDKLTKDEIKDGEK